MDPIELLLLLGVGWMLYSVYNPAPLDSLVQSIETGTGDVVNKTYSAAVIAFARAFNVAEEGGNVDPRTHNPGNLENGDIGLGLWNNITIYPNDAAGWDAFYHKIDNILAGRSLVYSPSMTISQLAHKYTATEQDAWAHNVSTVLGVTPDTTLADAAALHA